MLPRVMVVLVVIMILQGLFNLQSIVKAATAPPLGTAQSFAVLAGSTVTNTGPTTIKNGNLGVSPGNVVTGFPPGKVFAPATIQAGNGVSLQAQNDVTTAYNNLAGQPCNTDLTSRDLGGLTLKPGVYCFTTSAQLTGKLTLDSGGVTNPVFIFQIGSTLTTATDASVLLNSGVIPCNIFWQLGSSATLGTRTRLVGNVLAQASITLTTGANIYGRALARSGAVTLDSNSISLINCDIPITPPPPAPTATIAPSNTPTPIVTVASPMTPVPSATVVSSETPDITVTPVSSETPAPTDIPGTTIPIVTGVALPGLPETGRTGDNQPENNTLLFGLLTLGVVSIGILLVSYLLKKRSRN